MTTARKIEILIGIVLLIGLCVVCKVAYDEHQAVAQAEAVSKASQDKVAQYDKLIAQRDAADIQQQALSVQAQAKVKTSADAVQIITKYVTVPGPAATSATPEPPAAVVVNKDDIAAAVVAKLPPSPSYTLQTQDMSIQTAKKLIACDADQKSLVACKQDVADSSSAMAAQKEETEVWKQAAKGGTKMHRFLKVVKCAAIAGGGAAAVSAAGQSKWAGLGAVAGVVGCQFF
jgi:hypothetical protein